MANHFTIDLSFDEILRRTSILRAGQMLGAMEWSYRRSVEYAMERQQFGREIGKFQVVQQMLADLADHVLAATVLLEAAAESNSLMMAGAARSRLADATDCAITVSHQVHGAMGFSVEYALNHRTRRMMAWRDTYGSVPYWRRAVGNVLAISDRETLWHTLTATAQT
jgi:acyl-CoA dehydrogenase